MVAPITGPFVTSLYLNGPPTGSGFIPRILDQTRTTYRQKPPFDLPLQFTFVQRRVNSYFRSRSHLGYDNDYSVTISSTPAMVDPVASLYLKVYNAFKEEIGANVQAGVALAEGRQAMDMIVKRLSQLTSFGRNLRKGRFGDAARSIGLSLSNTQRKALEKNYVRFGAKSFANSYLELHFGWSPLLKDISDAAEVLSKPIVRIKVRTKRAAWFHTYGSLNSDNGNDRTLGGNKTTTYQAISLRADLQVSNPNLALANQCGIINPLAIAWELVPFSFVVDWFVNVGDFLNTFTDFSGITLINPNRTIFTRWMQTHNIASVYNYNSPLDSSPPNYYSFQKFYVSENYHLTGVYCQRINGDFPGPPLQVRDPWVLSAKRGLAAASLLIQQGLGAQAGLGWRR